MCSSLWTIHDSFDLQSLKADSSPAKNGHSGDIENASILEEDKIVNTPSEKIGPFKSTAGKRADARLLTEKLMQAGVAYYVMQVSDRDD